MESPSHALTAIPIPAGLVLLLLALPLRQEGVVTEAVVGGKRAADSDIQRCGPVRVPARDEDIGCSGAVTVASFQLTGVTCFPDQVCQGLL